MRAFGFPFCWLANCASPMVPCGARYVLHLNALGNAFFLQHGLQGTRGLVPAAAGIGRGNDGVIRCNRRKSDHACQKCADKKMLHLENPPQDALLGVVFGLCGGLSGRDLSVAATATRSSGGSQDFLPHLLPPPRNEEGLQSIIKSCHLTDTKQAFAHLLSINLGGTSTRMWGILAPSAFAGSQKLSRRALARRKSFFQSMT